MNKAIILNYAVSAVETAELPDELFTGDIYSPALDTSQKIELYLTDELGYNLSEISYMVTDGDCPVYKWDCNEPYAEI